MEKQLDTRLFDRTTQQIHLTESGERFCPMPIRCLTICNLCVMRINDLQDFHQGKVRIANTPATVSILDTEVDSFV